MISTFFILSLVFLVVGVPIAFTLGLPSVVYIFMSGMPPGIIIQRLFAGIDRTALMAIPFFILAGELMNRGGIAKRLVALANVLVGNIHGSLAIVTVLSCMFFCAISGSAVAAAASIGSIMIPAMLAAGYKREFAASIVAASSILGVILPPSITFITFGVISGTSITDMYLAGIPAGIMIGTMLIIYVYIVARKNNIRNEVASTTIKEKLLVFRNAIWAMFAPIILVGGVFSGFFTPTESAVVAVVYSLLVGFFVYGDLKLKDAYKVFAQTAIITGKIMLIIATATLFAFILTFERVPQEILSAIGTITDNKILILLLINLALLIMGTFMDTTAIIIITVPLFWPLIMYLGIDPVHFGLIVTINTAIGFITPPIGVCLFTVASVAKSRIEPLFKAVLPPVAVLIVALLIITFVPQTIMFLVGR
jgi:C4-dicarboxylate transporter DctM subunit